MREAEKKMRSAIKAHAAIVHDVINRMMIYYRVPVDAITQGHDDSEREEEYVTLGNKGFHIEMEPNQAGGWTFSAHPGHFSPTATGMLWVNDTGDAIYLTDEERGGLNGRVMLQ